MQNGVVKFCVSNVSKRRRSTDGGAGRILRRANGVAEVSTNQNRSAPALEYATLCAHGDFGLDVAKALTSLYISLVTPSSELMRTRLVPTRIRSSLRSFSRWALSRVWPWCCIRTQSLFISEKLSRMKSIESWIVPCLVKSRQGHKIAKSAPINNTTRGTAPEHAVHSPAPVAQKEQRCRSLPYFDSTESSGSSRLMLCSR